MGRIIEEHTPSKEYPTTKIASYCVYTCQYCLSDFYLVDPDTFRTGGVIQKEILARDIITREETKVGRLIPTCISCIRQAIWRQENAVRKDFTTSERVGILVGCGIIPESVPSG